MNRIRVKDNIRYTDER